jgi:excisionase family DNA binding protein
MQGRDVLAGEEYLTIREACERLGMSRSGLFALIRQRGLTRYRRPRDSRTYVSAEDLESARRKLPSQQRELIQPVGPNALLNPGTRDGSAGESGSR